MKPHQKIAIENHCRLAAETMSRLFQRTLAGGVSVIVTVNSGYE